MEVERIEKIKFLSGEGNKKIQLKFVTTNEDEMEIKYRDEPRPEFVPAMQALIPPCLELLELPVDYAAGMHATGISFSWTDGIMGAVVTLQKALLWAPSPLILNTPHLPSAPSSGGGEGDLLPDELVLALETCIEEAKLYIAGKRKQMDLFAGNGKEDKKDDEKKPSGLLDAVAHRIIDLAAKEVGEMV